MGETIYESLRAAASEGPERTLDLLAEELEERKQYHRLFDVLCMKARHELGLPLVLAPGEEIPSEKRAAYEDRLVQACRTVGSRLLAAGEIPSAYQYFQMIGEPGPVREAIEAYAPAGDERDGLVLEIAISHGVHPAKGIAMMLERYSLCQAITACEQLLHQGGSVADREQAIGVLVRSLHAELSSRLRSEIAEKEGQPPAADSIAELVAGRDWLFADHNYHIDTSHLNAVVRMARMLPSSPEVGLAADLCHYGRRLSERYRFPEPPPFENVFEDGLVYFRAIQGEDVDAGLAHFRAKADAARFDPAAGEPAFQTGPDPSANFPAEVYVNLLVRAGRLEEAIRFASERLPAGARLACPSVAELCQRARRFDDLARWAQEHGDLVGFAAAILQSR